MIRYIIASEHDTEVEMDYSRGIHPVIVFYGLKMTCLVTHFFSITILNGMAFCDVIVLYVLRPSFYVSLKHRSFSYIHREKKSKFLFFRTVIPDYTYNALTSC